MKEEIGAAVTFLTRLVGKNDEISSDHVQAFQQNLGKILAEKFKGHWFPEKPCKGQAYRCIRVNGRERRDPVLELAAERCGLQYENLRLPVELTVWVDPQEVCCRFGEDDGSYCTVASFKDGKENLPDNVFEEIHSQITITSHPSPVETQKKQKTRRKPLEKQQPKKPARNPPTQQSSVKGLGKTPLMPPLGGYFDWGMPPFPSPRRSYPPQDHPFMRRPKKPMRPPAYPNDRYHWAARK